MEQTAGLNPLLYSFDVLLSFVNLYQEHYWCTGESTLSAFVVGLDEFISVSR
jgi:hypothetical protein